MPEHDPVRLDALLRGLGADSHRYPQSVDKPVDGASTPGLTPHASGLPDTDIPQAVDKRADSTETGGEAAVTPAPADRDEDGLDVAWQVMDHLGASPQRPHRRKPATPAPSTRENGDLTPIGGALDAFVDERGWTSQVGLRMLLASWPQLVGEANAEHCHPDGFHDGVLTVRADSSAWASALRFIAPQVVAALNERLGQGTVTRIAVLAPSGPSWKHGPRSVRDGRGPRDTYG